MTELNSILLVNTDLQAWVWGELGLTVQDELLYGQLSERTHRPPLLKAAFVSNEKSTEYFGFFSEASKRFLDSPAVMYNEAAAVAAVSAQPSA